MSDVERPLQLRYCDGNSRYHLAPQGTTYRMPCIVAHYNQLHVPSRHSQVRAWWPLHFDETSVVQRRPCGRHGTSLLSSSRICTRPLPARRRSLRAHNNVTQRQKDALLGCRVRLVAVVAIM